MMDTNYSFESKPSKADSDVINKAIELRRKLHSADSKIPNLLKRQYAFKGRKSPLLGQIIMETLSNKDEIVVDPFVGSGSYIISAMESRREFFGCELDNYTADLINTYFNEANLDKLNNFFDQVKNACFDELRNLYETRCCGTENFISKLHFDPEDEEYYHPEEHRDITEGKNIIMIHKCPICGNKKKQFDEFDEKKIMSLENFNTDDFPNHTLIENSRINITYSTGADKYDRNFSQRNKIALLTIQNNISKLPESHEKHLLQHFLVSSLTLSKISQYGSGSEYIYQVMRKKAQDINVWENFAEKIRLFKSFYNEYIEGKTEWYHNALHFKEGDYKELLPTEFKNKKASLIITDPPYADQVPYIERNQLYRDWLYHFVNSEKFDLKQELLDNEIIISNAPSRKEFKDHYKYISDVGTMFMTFNDCLQTNGFVVLAVNLGKMKYFDMLSNYIQKARKHGFEYITRIDKDISDPSLRKQAAYTSTLSKEMYLVFSKLPVDKTYWFKGDENIEYKIKDYVYNLIVENDDSFNINKLVINIENKFFEERTTNGSPQQQRIASIIKNHFKLDRRQNVYLDENRLYVEFEDSETLFIKLYDIIPMIINKLLNKHDGIFTLEDIYFELSDKLCNGEPRLLAQILDSETKENDIINLIHNYCNETEKGFVRKTPPKNDFGQYKVDLRQVDPYELEHLIKELLTKEGYYDTAQLGGAGDRGIDLIAKKINMRTNKEEKSIFQVKRYISNVGSEPIQRLFSVKTTDGYDHGVCVTTSNYTLAGKEEASKTNISIVNGDELIEMFEKHYPGVYFISEIK